MLSTPSTFSLNPQPPFYKIKAFFAPLCHILRLVSAVRLAWRRKRPVWRVAGRSDPTDGRATGH